MSATPEQILAVAARAAQSASDAAVALREFATSQSTGSKQKFNEASKVVKPPEPFGSEDQENDQRQWKDFMLNFKSWLFYADPAFEQELKYVEEHSKDVLPLTGMSGEPKDRSLQLFSIFTGFLRGKPLRLLRQQEDRNGIEVYRQLVQLYQPSSKSRSLALLQAYMQAPQFVKDKTLLEQVLGLERLRSEYQRSSGNDVSDDLALSILVRCLPTHIRQHVQLQMSDSSSYQQVRSYILGYEVVTTSWSTARVHSELGVVGSYASGGQGAQAMEIDAIAYKGKGKGKSKDGFIQKGKGKGKEKGKFGGKGNVSQNWNSHQFKGGKSKGKDFSKGKSSGKSMQTSKLDPNQCSYCLNFGHRKAQCRKFMSDRNSGNVRQINDESYDGQSTAADTTASTVPTSAGVSNAGSSNPSTAQNVRKITRVTPYVQDLTLDEDYMAASCFACSHVKMIQQVDMFDISITDDDECWTYSPYIIEDLQHVRAVSYDFPAGGKVEILLDSGADSSVLPLSCGHVGHSVSLDATSRFVDAQGAPLGVSDKRVAELILGDDVIIKEQFIVAPVTGPIVCLVKLLKAGWEFRRVDGVLRLCKDGYSFPLYYRKNSLYTEGVISKVSEVQSSDSASSNCGAVRAIKLKALASLMPGWNQLTPDVWAIRSNSPTCVDTTYCPAQTLMWMRTTLVEYTSGWEVYEFSQPISELQDLEYTVPNRKNVLSMITIAHSYAVPAEFLGFDIEDDYIPSAPTIGLGIDDKADADTPAGGSDVQLPPIPEERPAEIPAAPDGEEPPPSERVIIAPSDGSVLVEGVRIGEDCTLKVIRTACETLGLSTRGSKRDCMGRLQKFIQQQELVAAHAATASMQADGKRHVDVQRKPEEPSPQQVAAHNLVHEPFEPWCELCVQFRARQDKHPASDGSRTSSSLVSFDFGFAQRTSDSDDRISFLACHDRDTGLIAAIPSLAKGGKYFQYLNTELVRFVVSTGHTELRMRCDGEPATLALLEACRKTCRSLGIRVIPETTAIGDHQSNGGAERAVELIRSHANILVTHLESCCKATKQTFGCCHPIYGWALVHSAWVHNRYRVHQGQTAYERATGRVYSGKVAQYGERVMAFVKQEKKADPKWLPAVWLGKTVSNDTHIVSDRGVILVTRSIRRLPDAFDLELCGNVESGPWDHGFTALGHKLFTTKRYQTGGPLPALPFEAPNTPDEAGDDPPSGDEGHRRSSSSPQDDLPPVAGAPVMEPPVPSPLQEREESKTKSGVQAKSGMKPPPHNAAISSSDIPMSTATSSAPVEIVSRDDLELEQSPRPNKQARTDNTDQTMAIQEQHEDESWSFSFEDSDAELLEDYDDGLDGPEIDDDIKIEDNKALEALMLPFDVHEPVLPSEELARLDDIADSIEVERLKTMGVLEELQDNHDVSSMKTLSTRFVRTWRDKTFGARRVWLRRSRLVAREYAWLADRTDLFSPASNAVSARLLQTMFLRNLDKGHILGALDVADAFLTVKQREPTLVSLASSQGCKVNFNLGKVLPGQRAGSQWWYEDITSVLCNELGMVQCEPYPNLLANRDRSCLILLHVDDMLVTGCKHFVTEKLLSVLKLHYKVSTSLMQEPGDEITFLKRNHRLLEGGKLAIQSHPRHVEQLMKLSGVKASSRPKKVPGHPLIDEVDSSVNLDPDESSVFRSCVGILLYLAADLPHCQHAIRYLSTGMSSPTKQKKDILRHLISFLHGTKDVQLCLDFRGDNVGIHHQYTQSFDEIHLEVFSDSDWGSNKQHRKSVSSGYVCCGGALLFSSSRTQKVISLSSGEAEVYAASPAACDGILVGRLIHFATGRVVVLHHLMDSSAARGVLSRQGVGRIRHLSCRILWLQQLVKLKGKLKDSIDQQHDTCHIVSGVSGQLNIADLGTKRLGKARLAELMRFCNLGFVCHDSFVAFESNDHVISQIKGLKFSAQQMADIPHLIAKLSILQSALSRANAEVLFDCKQIPMTLLDMVFSIFGYGIELLFTPIEIRAWQAVAVIFVVMTTLVMCFLEVKGYQASLRAWADLADLLADDEVELRREAYASYLRFKRRRQRPFHRRVLEYFTSPEQEDLVREERDVPSTVDGEQVGSAVIATAAATGPEPMDVDEEQNDVCEETDSQKRARYMHQRLEESSDVELWQELHHMDFENESSDDDATMGDASTNAETALIRARESAIRVYERRRLEAMDRNDLDELDALERNYEWLHYV